MLRSNYTYYYPLILSHYSPLALYNHLQQDFMFVVPKLLHHPSFLGNISLSRIPRSTDIQIIIAATMRRTGAQQNISCATVILFCVWVNTSPPRHILLDFAPTLRFIATIWRAGARWKRTHVPTLRFCVSHCLGHM